MEAFATVYRCRHGRSLGGDGAGIVSFMAGSVSVWTSGATLWQNVQKPDTTRAWCHRASRA